MSSEKIIYFNDTQEIILEVTSVVTGLCSAVGSALILHVICLDLKANLRQAYFRILLGLCTMDLVVSGGGLVIFGPWAVPKGTYFTSLARGNKATCTVNGFLLHMLFGSMLYTASLSAYFLLTIRYAATETWFRRYIEPLMHLVACLVPIVSGIFFAVHGTFNPLVVLPGFCWLSHDIGECAENGDVECMLTKTGDFRTLRQVLIGSISAIVWVIQVVSLVLVYLKVRSTTLRLRNYEGGASRASLKRTQETGRVALMYIVAYFVCFLPINLLNGVHVDWTQDSRVVPFTLALLTKSLTSLQGVFNCYIFMRARYRSLAEQKRSSVINLIERSRSIWSQNSSNLFHSKQSSDAPPCPRQMPEGHPCCNSIAEEPIEEESADARPE